MKPKRLHPYKITNAEAEKAFEILRGSGPSGPAVDRLRCLLKIRTGERSRLIRQGFRNDIEQIIEAAARLECK